MSFIHFFLKNFKKRKPFFYISKKSELIKLENEFSKANLLGVDCEFDWRRTYFPKLSTIQIVINEKLFLIDCLKVNPHNFLQKAFEDNKILKIFHSARSDATVLSKCLNIITKNVFDIQVAEKKLINGDIESYGKLVERYFRIKLNKNETNSNWLKRPLSESQIKYALEDVDFLIEIFELQKKKLLKKNIFNEVLYLSEIEVNLGNKSLKEIRVKKLKNKISKRNLDIFKWREDLALQANVPPAYIFKDNKIKELSKIISNDSKARKNIMKIIGDTNLTDSFISKFL